VESALGAFTAGRTLLGLLALGGLGALAAWGFRGRLPFAAAGAIPGRIPELAPLLRAAGKAVPPRPGDTARTWIERLAKGKPGQAGALKALSREADAVAYGGKGRTALARLAREASRGWKRGSE
jgi:hypothetical protein